MIDNGAIWGKYRHYYRIRYDDKYLVNSSFNFLNIWSNDNKAIIG